MKFIWKFNVTLFWTVLIVNIATAKTIRDPAERGYSNEISEIQLEIGEAAVWYLFHAGWAVKTASTLMIFDYSADGFLYKNGKIFSFYRAKLSTYSNDWWRK